MFEGRHFETKEMNQAGFLELNVYAKFDHDQISITTAFLVALLME